MTSAYVDGVFTNGPPLDASDLTQFAADVLAASRNLRPGVLGVGPIQPVIFPGLSSMGCVFTSNLNNGIALGGGFAQTTTGPIKALPFTVECLALTTGNGQPQVAVGQAYTFWLGCDGNGNATAHYYFGEPGGIEYVINTNTPIADGRFHHLAMVVQASGVVLYVDGNQVGSNSSPAGCYTTFAFGVRDFGGLAATPNQWSGLVEEVAVWSTAHYTGNFTKPNAAYTGSEPGLLACYHLGGDTSDIMAPAGVAIGARPATASGIEFLLRPSDSVLWSVQSASLDPRSTSFPYDFPISYEATGPNWFEPFTPDMMLFVKRATNIPRFRWL